ncbi:hypothetical protein JVU11DRAFT_87 [Chiua virens]|nr:hypothetical protein JVU11DRAFT_87 [Chiua virens]
MGSLASAIMQHDGRHAHPIVYLIRSVLDGQALAQMKGGGCFKDQKCVGVHTVYCYCHWSLGRWNLWMKPAGLLPRPQYHTCLVARLFRVEFTTVHDSYLTKYLANYCPTKAGRNGNAVYKQLEANIICGRGRSITRGNPGARATVKNSTQFDAAILAYQKRHSMKQGGSLKRPAEPTPMASLGRPSVKRARVNLRQDDDSGNSESSEAEVPLGSSATSPSKPTSTQSRPPSSQTRPAAPVSSTRTLVRSHSLDLRHLYQGTRTNGAPVAPTTNDRTEEAETSATWPPVRGHAGHKKTSGPDAEAETHHPFSQPLPPPGLEVMAKVEQARGRQKPTNPFLRDLVSDRHAVAAPRQAPRPTEIEPGEDVHRNGRHERSRERAVPSIDLVAVSSERSHSLSSTDVPAPKKASALVSPCPPDPTDTSSPVPRPRLSPNLVAHPQDVSVTSWQGLVTMLECMSANHGLPLSMVEAVYNHSENLREADEVLHGMQKAANRFGQRELERRRRRRRRERQGRRETMLRYVVASDDGEGEGRHLRIVRRKKRDANGETEQKSRDNEEEEADGRAVEAALGVSEDSEDDDTPAVPHDFSQQLPPANDPIPQDEEGRLLTRALVSNKEAQKLEKQMGKDAFLQAIVARFTFA